MKDYIITAAESSSNYILQSKLFIGSSAGARAEFHKPASYTKNGLKFCAKLPIDIFPKVCYNKYVIKREGNKPQGKGANPH